MKYSISMFLLLFTMLFLGSCNKDNGTQTPKPNITDSQGREISSDDNFARHKIQVGPSDEEFISYIDEGNGDEVILLLHGAPSYSYIWRNIIPHLSDNARVIAMDWVGSGNSGSSPDGDYSYLRQLSYLTSFIDKLGLNNITLVLHDWSTMTALPYAHQNQDKIKAIATFEAVYFPIPNIEVMPPLAQQFYGDEGEKMIVDDNAFMEIILPNFSIRNLAEEEFYNYRNRWEIKENRFALLAIPKGLPVSGQPADLWNQFGAASNWFAQNSTDVPKFFSYNLEGPGVLVTDAVADPNTGATIKDIVSSFPNTTTTPLDGPGLHFIQEDNPHDLGIAISNWFDGL